MEKLKWGWLKTPKSVRRILVFILGGLCIVLGLLLLVLPGPGFAAIFLGFAVLATEFTSAKRAQDGFIGWLKEVGRRLKKLWEQRKH
ncbi:MAG: PGPGW domain-containing protein [Candidatus Saccharimonadales bacterium]